jgi:hypothetical protein
VREWLGGMVAAEVIETDPETITYLLPDERAELLTDRGAVNLAVYAQFIPLLGGVEDEVVRCFREGGGVPYSRYPRFQEVMASDSGQTVLPALFDAILPLAPELPERLEAGIRVLDCACGRGRALMAMAERYPASRFVGYDFSAEAIEWAREQAAAAGLDNLSFEIREHQQGERCHPGQIGDANDEHHQHQRPAAAEAEQAVTHAEREGTADALAVVVEEKRPRLPTFFQTPILEAGILEGPGEHENGTGDDLGPVHQPVPVMHRGMQDASPVSAATPNTVQTTRYPPRNPARAAPGRGCPAETWLNRPIMGSDEGSIIAAICTCQATKNSKRLAWTVRSSTIRW